MNSQGLITVNGGAYTNVKKALRQWLQLYTDDLADGLLFELYRNGRGNHIIQTDGRLGDDHFFYLVNYLAYPEGIEYQVEVVGYIIPKDKKELMNQQVMVYIPENNEDGDNVYATTEDNKAFKIDFGGKITGVNGGKNFSWLKLNDLGHPEIIKLTKKEIDRQRQEQSSGNLEKRFRIGSLMVLGGTLASSLALLKNHHTFFEVMVFVGMGTGVWFFSDYKMLREEKYYVKCLLVALTFLGYVMVLKQVFGNRNTAMLDLAALYPISLLGVQRPARLLFKRLLNREPVIDNPMPTFWDGVYTMLLFLALIILPLIIAGSFK